MFQKKNHYISKLTQLNPTFTALLCPPSISLPIPKPELTCILERFFPENYYILPILSLNIYYEV